MSNDLFSSDPNPEGSSFETRPVIDPSKNYLEELVGEGRKFDSVEALARGKVEADEFIKSLLREKKEVLDELNKRATVDDLLAKLKETNGKDQLPMSNPTVNQHGNEGGQGGGAAGGSSLNLDEIKAAVKADLEREQVNRTREANIAEANKTLKETLGDNAASVLQQKATELGVSLEELRDMAAKSPKLLYATIGLGQSATPAATKRADVFTPSTSVNTAGMAQQKTGIVNGHRTASYYEKLKNTDKKAYLDPKTAVQMHKDAIALGAAFFDT